MKYRRIIQAFQSHPWAILPAKLQEVIAFLELKAAGGSVSEEEMREHFMDDGERDRGSTDPPPPQSIAVIPIHGVLARRMNMMTRASGGTSLGQVSKALRSASGSDTVKAIVLDFDSPGGEVMGITELHAEILRARKKKLIVAHVSGMAASAAYHLASAAQEISATPSAMLGSIGVMSVHIDESKAMADQGLGVTLKTAGKFKADASGLVPLSEEGEKELQRRVDESYEIMIRDISKGRGLPVARVRKDFGDARVVLSALALDLGMIDRIESFESVITRLSGGKRAPSALRGELNAEPLRVGEVVIGEGEAVMPSGGGDALAEEIAQKVNPVQPAAAIEHVPDPTPAAADPITPDDLLAAAAAEAADAAAATAASDADKDARARITRSKRLRVEHDHHSQLTRHLLLP